MILVAGKKEYKIFEWMHIRTLKMWGKNIIVEE